MTPLARGLVVAVVHVLLVAGVAGKLLYDRQSLPSVWAPTTGVDPYLPIRGRYVELRLVVDVAGGGAPAAQEGGEPALAWARLSAVDGQLRATLVSQPDAATFMTPEGLAVQQVDTPAGRRWTLAEPIAFFLPEAGPDPTQLAEDETLWAEVTVPADGPPRPIRLETRPTD